MWFKRGKVAGYALQGVVVNEVLTEARRDTDGVDEAIHKAFTIVDAYVAEPRAASRVLEAVVLELLRPQAN